VKDTSNFFQSLNNLAHIDIKLIHFLNYIDPGAWANLGTPCLRCDVGHVMCSPCRDKLSDNRKCHVCRGSTGGFCLCHAMERPVESAHVACPNAVYGCAARPAYYEQQAHRQLCLHAPCRCPGDACSFIGPTEAHLDHFAGVHGWPCSTKVRTGEMSSVRLKDGSSTSS
jgi:E3 ubiquitin-protein ligase SIAH1